MQKWVCIHFKVDNKNVASVYVMHPQVKDFYAESHLMAGSGRKEFENVT